MSKHDKAIGWPPCPKDDGSSLVFKSNQSMTNVNLWGSDLLATTPVHKVSLNCEFHGGQRQVSLPLCVHRVESHHLMVCVVTMEWTPVDTQWSTSLSSLISPPPRHFIASGFLPVASSRINPFNSRVLNNCYLWIREELNLLPCTIYIHTSEQI